MTMTVTEDITVGANVMADLSTYNLTVGNSYQDDGWYTIERYGFGSVGLDAPITNGSISPTKFKDNTIYNFFIEQRYFADGALEGYSIWIALAGNTQSTIKQIQATINGSTYTCAYSKISGNITYYEYFFDSSWTFPAWTYLYQNRGKIVSVTFN